MNQDKTPQPLTALEALKAWSKELEAKQKREIFGQELEQIKSQLAELKVELEQIQKYLDQG
jgi:hypothetical protein